MAVDEELDALLDGLGELEGHCAVLAALARVLAQTIVHGEEKSTASAVRELRATLVELMERSRVGTDDDETWDFGSGSATLRDASELRPADVRSRGRGGGAAAG